MEKSGTPMQLKRALFIHPVRVAGRSHNSLAELDAEIVDFPWVRVWEKGRPHTRELTTIFNIASCNDFLYQPPQEQEAPQPPQPEAKKK